MSSMPAMRDASDTVVGDMSGDEQTEKSGSAVKSVDRALQILEMIGRSGTAGVSELALELGVHKSTVSRLIASMEARGFVEQVSDRGKYRIGFTVVRLAGAAETPFDLGRQGQDICDMLALEVGETANLAVLDTDTGQAVNVVEAQSPSSVALRSWVGQSSPAHATSSGKALLADLPPKELTAVLGSRLQRYTDTTITSMAELRADLAEVNRRGWALADEEYEVGLVAVGAPVRDYTGAVVAALCVSGPRYRLDPAEGARVGAVVAAAADRLSERFGYAPLTPATRPVPPTAAEAARN